jgi:acyl-CoA thioesterase-2
VSERICHSLQSYFIRPGDPTIPVLYQVERSRDGKSFATRRVLAIQKGEQIFNMACSFQVPEDGYEHQSEMPEPAFSPEQMAAFIEAWMKTAPAEQTRWLRDSPIEIRAIDPVDVAAPVPKSPQQNVWLRARTDLGDDIALNQALLAYASDYSLLGTAMRPHGVSWQSGVQTASLDHILWFHRPTNFSRWHFYVQDSPSASGARGFNRGAIYRDDGTLVASAAQEGLIRPRT